MELNTLEVKSILHDHLSSLIEKDPLLVRHNSFGELLIKNLEISCLVDKRCLVLIDHLKAQIASDPFIIRCLNFQLDLDFYKETRIKAISTCLRLDLDALIKLINKMHVNEVEIQGSTIKNYPNSVVHRRQVKIWQFLLIVTMKLLKSLNQQAELTKVEEMLRLIYDLTIKSVIKQSSTQPSVKLLQQIVIIILIKDDKCPKEFYEEFRNLLEIGSTSDYLCDLSRNKQNEISKIGYITSLLSIVFHLIKFRPELKCYPINYLLTCNHYRTRLFSHLVLIKNAVTISLPVDTDQHLDLDAMPKSISGSNNIVSD